MAKLRKGMIGIAVVLLILVPVWIFFITPYFEIISSDFSYGASIISKDNFYDAETGDYSGEIASDTQFTYEVVSKSGGILTIKNLFDVRTPSGKPIFAVERLYGIDSKTGKHVGGYGDRNREGYLFAPRDLERGKDYTYWHINYDTPAEMKFQGEEIINGLTIYRYEVDYHADQTANLGHLPGVPEERGIELDINLQTWIEPVTGKMVKYEDSTVAYYYDINTGERIHPWNKFGNRYSDDSVSNQIRLAQNGKQQIFLYKTIIPILFGLVAIALLVVSWISRENKEKFKKEVVQPKNKEGVKKNE